MDNSISFYQSKTIWFNLITIILAVLAMPQFISLIPGSWEPYIALINGLGNTYLRMITNRPIQ